MKKQTAGRDLLNDFAPKFASLNDDILFGEIWSREDKLSLHDRSLITISTLISKGILDSSLKYHIQSAKNNGVSKQEIVEVITHIAFYAGWPNAWAAFNIAKEVYKDDNDLENKGGIFGLGKLNTEYKQYFVGKSYLNPLTNPNKDPIFICNVTFEPGCRNNWHIHKATGGGGQVLICVDGNGYYQQEGLKPRSLSKGDVVIIPPNIKHWHGASKNSWFSHLAFELNGENTSTTWLEKVSDEEYNKLD